MKILEKVELTPDEITMAGAMSCAKICMDNPFLAMVGDSLAQVCATMTGLLTTDVGLEEVRKELKKHKEEEEEEDVKIEYTEG